MPADEEVHANVKAIQDIEAACERFATVLLNQLPEVQRELQATTERLEDHRTALAVEIRKLEDDIASAEEDDDVSYQRERLENAEEQLSSTSRQIRRLAEVRANYAKRANAAEHLASTHTVQARQVLRRTADDLKAYLAVHGNFGDHANEPRISVGIDRGLGVTAGNRLEQAWYVPPADPRYPRSVVARGAALAESSVSPAQLKLAGDREMTAALGRGFEILSTIPLGRRLITILHSVEANIKFGPCSENGRDYYGSYDWKSKPPVLTLSENLRGRPAGVIATHLAHEATHAKWHRSGSIEQEYDAFNTEAAVWSFLQKSDPECRTEPDSHLVNVCNMIAQGEQRAKKTIRKFYPKLPEFDDAVQYGTILRS